ncbi:hypothetical protein C0Q63_13410 [Streptomyces albidoflavus]|nr:hypothetical protein C0Q63_13410 [Streptomyces albidoflavus]
MRPPAAPAPAGPPGPGPEPEHGWSVALRRRLGDPYVFVATGPRRHEGGSGRSGRLAPRPSPRNTPVDFL